MKKEKKEKRYRIIIAVLLGVVAVQAVMLLRGRPAKEPKEIAVVPPPVVIKGRIAIVLDDWGYNLRNLQTLSKIKYPLTLSVLPNLSYSRQIAEKAHRLGFEIILHLPMEPMEKFRLEKDTILTNMDARQITAILDKDLAAVPYCRGVSNHMGSRATGDIRTMKIVFGELKKRRLFFLDSLVSSRSVCSELAGQMDLPFAKRDIFLDNEEDARYISRQLQKLKSRARTQGKAIGIGHDRPVTLAVLKEELPKLEKEGYKIVFVSQMEK